MYVFQLFDYYGASGMCLLWFCFFECIVIAWIYGADKFTNNIKEMIGFKMSPWFPFCWKYISGVVTLGILVFSFVTYKPIKYNNVYEYPWWAIAFGWFLALSSMIAIPVYCVYIWIVTPSQGKSFSQKWKMLTTSSPSQYVLANPVGKEGHEEETDTDVNEKSNGDVNQKPFPDIVLIQK